MNKITWKHIDYNNDSLNSIARNIAEYHTAHALKVKYSTTKGVPLGTIFLDDKHTVENISVLNSILNYNVYFKKNTEVPLKTIIDPDCVVALASGDTPSQLLAKHTYVIDISPMALEKTKEKYNIDVAKSYNYNQVDLFDIPAVKKFLTKCQGNVGLFCLSNVFLYFPNCVMFDAKARLKKQNELISLLAQDKIKWYVDMITVNGTYIQTLASELVDMTLDDKFKVLPWI
jgi:hypothetical protein|tara:strand:- start:696 stop:1385 length:690 start_codon:yes stop_codon:yes gene_type:complete